MSFLRFFNFLGKYKDIVNVTKIIVPKSTAGQNAADHLTAFVGSWKFIILLFLLITFWITMNIYYLFVQWDPYPFILLNFILSTLAATQAPIIMMSQNRHAEIDRVRAEYDYQVNIKAEKEIENMQKDLEQIKSVLAGINDKLSRKH